MTDNMLAQDDGKYVPEFDEHGVPIIPEGMKASLDERPNPNDNIPEAPAPGPKAEPGAEPEILKNLEKELSEGAQDEERDENAPEGVTPLPFDLTKISPDQLATLKQMLNATPDRQVRKKLKPKTKIRMYRGTPVVNHKRAYLALVRDTEMRADVERHVIPILLIDEKEYRNVLYSDFMNLPQVSCEIVHMKSEEHEIVEGETVSKENGKLVEMIMKTVDVSFTIKLADGRDIEIPGHVSNG